MAWVAVEVEDWVAWVVVEVGEWVAWIVVEVGDRVVPWIAVQVGEWVVCIAVEVDEWVACVGVREQKPAAVGVRQLIDVGVCWMVPVGDQVAVCPSSFSKMPSSMMVDVFSRAFVKAGEGVVSSQCGANEGRSHGLKYKVGGGLRLHARRREQDAPRTAAVCW